MTMTINRETPACPRRGFSFGLSIHFAEGINRMLYIYEPITLNKNRRVSKASRNYHSLKATALDVSKFPILVKHWPGIIAIGDDLAVNDNFTVKLPNGVRYE